MIGGFIYRLFKTSIDRHIFLNQGSVDHMDHMEYSFSDSKGVRYYTWPDIAMIPFIRRQEIQKRMLEVEAGLPGADQEDFVLARNKAFENYKKARTPEDKEKADMEFKWFGQEMLNRRHIPIAETMFLLVASLHIPEGKDPTVWDISAEEAKAARFKIDAETGLAAFFLRVNIAGLINLKNMSESELRASITAADYIRKGNKEMIGRYLSGPGGKKKPGQPKP